MPTNWRALPPDPRLTALLADPTPRRWLTIGDSVAAGARWTDGERDYHQLLEERVRHELERHGDTFARLAVSGATTEDTLRMAPAIAAQHADIVLIGLGLNDAKSGAAGLDRFAQRYAELLTRVGEGAAVVIAQTPNAVAPEALPAIVETVADYAAAIGDLAHRHDAVVVDHHARWIDSGGGRAPSAWLGDPIHPNGRGHRAMARTLLDAWGAVDPAGDLGRLLIGAETDAEAVAR